MSVDFLSLTSQYAAVLCAGLTPEDPPHVDLAYQLSKLLWHMMHSCILSHITIKVKIPPCWVLALTEFQEADPCCHSDDKVQWEKT